MFRERLTCCSGLAFNDTDLHEFDLDSDEQEVDFSDQHVLEMVLGFIVFKLDMKAVLNTDLRHDKHSFIIVSI